MEGRNDTWNYDTRHNDIQHSNNKNVTIIIMTLRITAELRYAECRLCCLLCPVSHISPLYLVSLHYAECRNAECRVAIGSTERY
jgi:hypothetical protein